MSINLSRIKTGVFYSAVLFILILFIEFVSVVEAPVAYGVTGESDMNDAVTSYVAGQNIGNEAAAVIALSGGDLVSEQYYGYTDADGTVKNSPSAVFEWGQASDLLVWISVMQLVEADKINLNSDIGIYLPADFVYPNQKEDNISMSDLMNHTAGFDNTLIGVRDASVDSESTLRDALENFDVIQEFSSGEVTSYSSYSVALAAYVVENVTDMEFTTYVNNNIFGPLGMTETSVSYDGEDNSTVASRRESMVSYSAEGMAIEGASGFYPLYPAFSATGTAHDLAKLVRALLGGSFIGLFDDDETLTDFFTATATFPGQTDSRIAHGMFAFPAQGEVFGQSGTTAGYTASIYMNYIDQTATIVMVNKSGETALSQGIPRLIFGDQPSSKAELKTSTETWEGYYYSTESCMHGPSKLFTILNVSNIVATEELKGLKINGQPLTRIDNGVFLSASAPENIDTYYFHYDLKYGRSFSTALYDYNIAASDDFRLGVALLILWAVAIVGFIGYLIWATSAAIYRLIRRRKARYHVFENLLSLGGLIETLNVTWLLYTIQETTAITATTVHSTISQIYFVLIVIVLMSAVYQIGRSFKNENNPDSRRNISRARSIAIWSLLVANMILALNLMYWEVLL